MVEIAGKKWKARHLSMTYNTYRFRSICKDTSLFYFRTILKGEWGVFFQTLFQIKRRQKKNQHFFCCIKKTKLTMKNMVGAVIYKISDFISPCSYTKQGSLMYVLHIFTLTFDQPVSVYLPVLWGKLFWLKWKKKQKNFEACVYFRSTLVKS